MSTNCISCRNKYIPKKEYSFENKEPLDTLTILYNPKDINLTNFQQVLKHHWSRGVRPLIVVHKKDYDEWKKKLLTWNTDLIIMEGNNA